MLILLLNKLVVVEVRPWVVRHPLAKLVDEVPSPKSLVKLVADEMARVIVSTPVYLDKLADEEENNKQIINNYLYNFTI